MQQPSPPPTLDSSLNKFQEYNVFPENVVHPFASETADSISLLKSLLETTNNISESLSAYSTVEWTNPKVISFLRQGCNTAQGLYTVGVHSIHVLELVDSNLEHSVVREAKPAYYKRPSRTRPHQLWREHPPRICPNP